ncbi:uncharacterized protein LOC122004711 [Zingiber officinale]|uniref:Uncharacterized protein n=1 Tax=Zingiber officinale TaxID=94328 RepID=A0A8J5KVH0_ZINOF|nr:uncharacterized protein LOC122004711 [Zingiber officinale]KAG6491163.1 hypothetical protein ZIOFF_052496 [Zingiber officinale]
MKASIKFREEASPLVRAKIPIAVLGLPFLSGFAVGAGDAFQDVRFDIATSFRVGPSLRLSYRPNDYRKPFSLVLKTGTGTLGSPSGNSPLVMSAEFGLQSGRPDFSLLLKPNFGDFSIKKVVDAAAPVNVSAESPPAVEVKVSAFCDEKNPEFVQFHAHEPIGSGKKLSGDPIDISTLATGRGGGIDGLLSGFEVSARSILRLPKRAAVRFKWGLRVPPELRSALDDPKGPMISLSKLPLLSLSKITIERSTADAHTERKKPVATKDADASARALLRGDVEALRSDSILLKRALEDLRAEVGARKFTPAASAAARKEEQRGNGKPSRSTGKPESFSAEEPKKPSATSPTARA